MDRQSNYKGIPLTSHEVTHDDIFSENTYLLHSSCENKEDAHMTTDINRETDSGKQSSTILASSHIRVTSQIVEPQTKDPVRQIRSSGRVAPILTSNMNGVGSILTSDGEHLVVDDSWDDKSDCGTYMSSSSTLDPYTNSPDEMTEESHETSRVISAYGDSKNTGIEQLPIKNTFIFAK